MQAQTSTGGGGKTSPDRGKKGERPRLHLYHTFGSSYVLEGCVGRPPGEECNEEKESDHAQDGQ